MSMITASQVNARKLVYLAPLAGLIAAVINVALFLIGLSTGAIPGDFIIPNAGQPLSAMPMIVASIFPALAAGGVLAVLNRFTKNPLRIFNIISLILLVLSFASPFSVPNMPMGMVIILELMHVVVAAAVVYVFNRYAKN